MPERLLEDRFVDPQGPQFDALIELMYTHCQNQCDSCSIKEKCREWWDGMVMADRPRTMSVLQRYREFKKMIKGVKWTT
jgi:hypothetical protein